MDAWVEVPESGDERAEEARPRAAAIWAEPRHLFFFRLGALIGDGSQKPIEILALAESGAIVRIDESLEEGGRLLLELNSDHRFAARVEWSSDTLAGLEFEERDQVREILAGRDRSHPYRAPRLELDAEVVLRLGETCLTAQAKDVSEGGIKVELAEPGHVGREASVIVPGMPPVAGRILWCRDGRAGISFERPLPFRSLMDCLTRQPAEQPRA
ncbi:MAG TPA: PilZ domain-containing protein [Allosphingosinicella sp.]|nr:PilZ domain-containing protein [Allosphingosinicella sp.]